jgi:hypothetical protein
MFLNYRTHFYDTEVTKFQHLVGQLACDDSDDEHVLAGAIVGRATHLLTFNSTDFPSNTQALYGISISNPDEFLVQLLGLSPNADELLAHWLSLFRQPEASAAYAAHAMAKSDCQQLATLLKEREANIDFKLNQLRGKNPK